jgi:phage tail sheath gpL-like
VTIGIAGLASSRKTPGYYFNVILGGASTSAGEAPRKILLVGNKITTDLTAAAPSFTVAAGTQANAVPVAVYSADDVATYFGRGSELHRPAKRVFEQYPDAAVFCMAVAESGGAKATGVYTFVTTASGAFSVRFKLSTETFDVAVASGDSITAIATACATAILARPDLGMTAQFSAGVLTLTAKHPGPRGNDLVVDAFFVNAAGLETRITTSSTSSGSGTTCTLSGQTTVEGAYYLSGGTTADDVTAALAAVVSSTYHRQVWAHRDTTNVDLINAQIDSLAGVTAQRRQQVVYGSLSSLATAITLATGRNKARAQIVWHYNSPVPIEEVAAQECAARLIGDSAAGGVLPGEATDPAANLDGLRLKSILPQSSVADQPTATEIESALNNGLTPLMPASGNRVAVVRSVTTRSIGAASQPNYSVLDTSVVTIADFITDDMQADAATTWQGFKLAPDNADGSSPEVPLVTTPSLIRARFFRKLKSYEAAAILINVDAWKANLQTALSATPGRCDAEIPFEAIPGLHILGANVRQVGGAA